MIHKSQAVTIRKMFASALSEMFIQEIPEYIKFAQIVQASNENFLAQNHSSVQAMSEQRVLEEKHGAIRVSTPEEMQMFARIFNIMGMHAVEFYDLTQVVTGAIPMISTAFRPIDGTMKDSAFRMFCSMLHPSYIPEEVRLEVDKILLERKDNPKFSNDLKALIQTAEAQELSDLEAKKFVKEVVNALRLDKEKPINFPLYKALREKSDVFADNIVIGVNVNHLTPRAFDIRDAQDRLEKSGIPMKQGGIEGPPIRDYGVNIQLNQTSRKAEGELIPASRDQKIIDLFYSDKNQYNELKAKAPIMRMGANQAVKDYLLAIEKELETHQLILIEHKSRFGEIEARNTALTEAGEKLYAALQAEKKYELDFPKTHLEMFEQNLAYYTFEIAKSDGLNQEIRYDLKYLVQKGYLNLVPQIYEDFLAVSAAGIFQSNMSNGVQGNSNSIITDTHQNRSLLEVAIGHKIMSRHDISNAIQAESIINAYNALDIKMPRALSILCKQQIEGITNNVSK